MTGDPREPSGGAAAGRPARTRRSRRRRALIAFAILCVAVVAGFIGVDLALRTPAVARMLARRVEASLARGTGCDVTIERVEARALPPRVTLHGLQLTREGRVVASVERAQGRAWLQPLLVGRLEVARLEASGVTIDADLRHLPRPTTPRAGRRRVSVHVVSVEDARVRLVGLPGEGVFEGNVSLSSGAAWQVGALSLDVEVAEATWQGWGKTLAGVAASGHVSWRDDVVGLGDVEASVAGFGTVEGSGEVRRQGEGRPPIWRFELESDADAARLMTLRFPDRDWPDLAGRLQVDGILTGTGGGWRLSGDVASDELVVSDIRAGTKVLGPAVTLTDVEGTLSATRGDFTVEDATARGMSGDLTADVRVRSTPSGPVVAIRGEARGADASLVPLPPALGSKLPPVAARVDATITAALPVRAFAEISGGWTLTLRPVESLRHPSRVDADASFGGVFRDRQVVIERGAGRIAGSDVLLTGRADWAGPLDLSLDVTTDDIAVPAAALAPHYPAFERFSSWTPQGRAAWRARVEGPSGDPTFVGPLLVEDLDLFALPLGVLDAEATLELDNARLDAALLRGPLGDVELDLATGLKDLKELTGEWSASRLDLAAIAEAFGAPDRVSGLATGAGTFLPHGGEAAAHGTVSGEKLTVMGKLLDRASFTGLASPSTVVIEEVTAARGSASVRAEGEMPWRGAGGSLRAHVEGPLVDLLGREEPTGDVVADLTLTGALLEPVVESGSASVARITWGSFGPLDVAADLSRDGEYVVLAMREGSAVQGTVRIAPTEPHAVDGTLRLAELSAPLRIGQSERVIAMDARGLEIRVSGALADFEQLEHAWTLEALSLAHADWSVESAGAITARGRGRDLEIDQAPLGVLGQVVQVGGKVRFVDPPEYVLTIHGQADARTFEPVAGPVRLAGNALVDLRVEGHGDHVDLFGRLELTGGYVKPVGFPHSLEEVDALIEADGHVIRLVRFSGLLGGGFVEGEGELHLAGMTIGSHVLRLRGESISLRVPEGLQFRSVSDFDVEWSGEAGQSAVLGRVRLLHGSYQKDLHLESSFLSRTRRIDAPPPPGPLDDVRLDVDIVAEDGLWLDNDLANAEFQADLQVAGTAARPVLIGTAEALDEGSITFQGVRYRLLGGSAIFSYLDPNDPEVTGQAETFVGGYKIELTLSGRLSRPRFDLSSEPELPRERIVALLLTGGAYGGDADVAVADELADDYLEGRIGPVSTTLQRMSYLDVVQVDPVFLEGQGDHTARVTVAENVAKDLLASYSTYLGGATEATAELRYQIDRHFLLRQARESDGSNVSEVRYLRSYSGGAKTAAIEPVGTPIASVKIEGEAPPPGEEALLKALDLPVGKKADERELRRAGHRGRRHLAEHEHPIGRVRCTAPEPAEGAGLDVTCVLSPGPTAALEIEGIGHQADGMGRKETRWSKRRVWDDWAELAHPDELAPEAVASIEEVMLERGHAHVSATGESEEVEGGVLVRVVVDPGPQVHVRTAEVKGASEIPVKEARGVLESAHRELFGRPRLTPDLLEQDAAALESLYYSQGFLSAKILDPQVEYPSNPAHAVVTFVVEEGKRSRVTEVAFEGLKLFGEEELRARLAREPYEQPVGAFLAPAELDEFSRRIKADHDTKGYPDALVSWHLEPVGPAEQGALGARVIYEVSQGPEVKLGTVRVEGKPLTRESVILKTLRLEQGEPFSRQGLIESQRRLAKLGVFRTSIVKGVRNPDDASVRDVVVRVREKDNIELSAGLGWADDEGPRVSFALATRNLGGRAASLGLNLRVGGEDERAEILTGLKGVGGSRVDLLSSIGTRDEKRESFRVKRDTFALQGTRELSERTFAQVRYKIEDIALSELEVPISETGFENGIVAGIGFSVTRDTRDDPITPTGGTFSSGDLAVNLDQLGSDSEHAKLFLQHSRFYRVGKRLVYGTSARLGLAETYGATEKVPLSERFFAGGVTSVRGYHRDELGPRDSLTGEPLGGEAVLVFNQELQVPITNRMSALVFLDAGNVFSTTNDVSLSGLEWTAGPGIGVATPAGVLRLYHGFKLDPDPDESGGRFHFTFGPTF